MLLVSRKNGKYNKLSNKIIVCHKLYSDKKPFTHYLNKWLPLRSKEDFKENWIAFKGKLAICSTITTILNDTLFSTDAVENSSSIYELNTFCTWHVKCIWKKKHWVYFTAEFQKLRYLNIIRNTYNVHVHYLIRRHLSRLGLYFSFAKLTQNLISLLQVFFVSVYRQLGVLEGICFPFSTIKWTVYSLNLLTSTGLDQWPWN